MADPASPPRSATRTSGTSSTRPGDFVRSVVMPRELEIMNDNRVPDDIRDQAKKMGLFGYAIPQEWGGLGLNIAQDVETGDGVRLHHAGAAVDVRHQQRHRRSGAGRLRHRRAEDPLAGGHRLGRRRRVVRADRARRGIEPGGLAHQGRSRRRRLGDHRTQAVHHQRADRRPLHRLRPHPARRRRRPRHRGVPGARRRGRASRSAPRTPRWARRAPGPPTSTSTRCGSATTRSSAAPWTSATAPR